MQKDFIDYGRLVDEAMHIIVFKVLKLVGEHGLPGEHHFFISFLTRYPGAVVSETLRNKYPKEMTIVMQYQYQDLTVDSLGFGVTLSFSGRKESIYIPYAAITTFADPSVQFGLQFREVDYEDEMDGDVQTIGDNMVPENIMASTTVIPAMKGGKKKAKENNVVMLDQFRGKHKG